MREKYKNYVYFVKRGEYYGKKRENNRYRLGYK